MRKEILKDPLKKLFLHSNSSFEKFRPSKTLIFIFQSAQYTQILFPCNPPDLNIPDIVLFFLTVILYAVSVILMFKSYITTSVANASFLSHLMLLIVPFIAFFILGEKINRAVFMGIGLVFVGIMIFIGQDIVNGKRSFWGELDAFLATVCLSFWIIIKTLRTRYQPSMSNALYIFSAIYFAAVYTFSYEDNLLPHTVEGWVIVAVNAICVQVFCGAGALYLCCERVELNRGFINPALCFRAFNAMCMSCVG